VERRAQRRAVFLFAPSLCLTHLRLRAIARVRPAQSVAVTHAAARPGCRLSAQLLGPYSGKTKRHRLRTHPRAVEDGRDLYVAGALAKAPPLEIERCGAPGAHRTKNLHVRTPSQDASRLHVRTSHVDVQPGIPGAARAPGEQLRRLDILLLDSAACWRADASTLRVRVCASLTHTCTGCPADCQPPCSVRRAGTVGNERGGAVPPFRPRPFRCR
jgi:hypothetical protein